MGTGEKVWSWAQKAMVVIVILSGAVYLNHSGVIPTIQSPVVVH